ncbi:MAG TPA: helicase HerA-like domain-containing protein [Thermoanaerobaculia bacterium]|nr:helicase HerA-like domain-containing protein [Thermoanaerobaculia bacterium]
MPPGGTGLFLGRAVDPDSGKTGAEPLLLDPADLTTHGLIVGMTGSGKTALGIVLIEELLLRGIPVLAIDPKGDLGNLLLDFPGLSAAEFAPFVDPSAGTPESESRKWADGLAGWSLGTADVRALVDSRDAVIYTPGSSSGTPVDLFGSCAPPPEAADDEDRRDVVTAWVGGLLGLAGRDADPVKSRDFIFLSACVTALWEKGATASFESLLESAAAPPFSRVGALPLETFYPAKERQELILAVNALLASPATSAFREGEPLDVGKMLAPKNGRTRLSIVSIAHLGDAERVFVVATLLSRVKAWMRSLPGSPALRALVYVDEIFGFYPPTAEPPTKKPLLTLLKQARAFGVGVVLASQNPVDLDYRGLANCGCWWLGTLQTERDRRRLAEGLVEAGGKDASALLDKTRKRVFLLNDVHRKEPTLVETRWAMSYLRGPMTKADLAKLKAEGGARAAPPKRGKAPADSAAPALPSAWPSRWLEKRNADIASPSLFVKYAVRYHSGTSSAPETTSAKLFPLTAGSPAEVLEAEAVDLGPFELDALKGAAPARPLRYAELPGWFGEGAVKAVEKAVRTRLPDKLAATLLKDPVTGALSSPGEMPDAFASRLESAVEAPAALREKLEKKRRDLAAAEAAEQSRSMETMATGLGAAVDLLGGLLGKRKSLRVGRIGSVLTKHRMEGTAESKVEGLKAEVAALEAKLAPPDAARFEKVNVVPAAAHVDVLSIGVAWIC